MVVLLVLVVSLLGFRELGALGVAAFATWHDSTRCALTVLFLFTSTAHFTKMRYDLANMVPRVVTQPLMVVYITGICELLGAVGILLPRFRSLAGACLV